MTTVPGDIRKNGLLLQPSDLCPECGNKGHLVSDHDDGHMRQCSRCACVIQTVNHHMQVRSYVLVTDIAGAGQLGGSLSGISATSTATLTTQPRFAGVAAGVSAASTATLTTAIRFAGVVGVASAAGAAPLTATIRLVGAGAAVAAVTTTELTSGVVVGSIAALKTALANNSHDLILVTAGTYSVAPALSQAATSLYIGSAFASRTRPVTVRPVSGTVTFDGGNADPSTGMMFMEGAHHQTWDGFHFANMLPRDTGVVVFGGDPTFAPAHDITLKNCVLDSTCRRTASGSVNEQGFYLAHALTRGPYNIVLDTCSAVATHALCLWAPLHGFHGDATHPPADHVTINNMTINGGVKAVTLWYDTGVMDNWSINNLVVTNATEHAWRFESVGATNVTVTNCSSTGSGFAGFYSSLCTPTSDFSDLAPGVVFSGSSFA